MKKYTSLFQSILLVILLLCFLFFYRKSVVQSRELDRKEDVIKILGELDRTNRVSYNEELNKLQSTVEVKEESLRDLRRSKDSVIQNLNKELKSLGKKNAKMAIALSAATNSVTIVPDTQYIDRFIDTTSQREYSKSLFYDGYLNAEIYGWGVDSLDYSYNVGDISIITTVNKEGRILFWPRRKVLVTTVFFDNKNLLLHEYRVYKNFKRKRWWEIWKK